MRKISLLATALFIFFAGVNARAWDAGPEKCKHNECSGGALAVATGVPDTQPKWASSILPSSTGRVADCPSGYTNNGLTCGRSADSYSQTSSVANCPSGFTNIGLLCFSAPDTYTKGCTTVFGKYDCRSGYTDWGCFCARGEVLSTAMTCPAGSFLNPATGRCYPNCRAGYTNMGESCFRGVDTKGIDAMTCNADEFKSGVRCYPKDTTCPPDREFWGGLCYNKCPPGSDRTAVSTCVHDISWRGNTHLFIVDRAIQALQTAAVSNPADATLSRAVSTMNGCRNDWENGLWDGDSGDLADAPGKAAGSHFYNASGKDETGAATSVVTYTVVGVEQLAHGTARSNAQKQLTGLSSCYNVGLALHYLTDMTQPMHATSFSGGGIPLMLHPVMEDYAPSLHSKVTAQAWDRRWVGQSPDDVLVAASKRSATLAPALMASLVSDDATFCTMTPEAGITYTGYCWLQTPAADQTIVSVISDGIHTTASYLYSIFKDLGAPNSLIIQSGDGQEKRIRSNDLIGTIFGPLAVMATNSVGGSASGVQVTFTCAAPAGMICELRNATVTTDANGVARLSFGGAADSIGMYAQNSAAADVTGTVTVTASAPGYQPVTFHETVVK